MMSFVLVYGILFPFSEVSAGGNYNLSFLAPSIRRALSPAASINPGPPPDQFPPDTLVPYFPVSLYVPRAGFLWTDDLVWMDDFGTFASEPRVAARSPHHHEALASAPQRAFFADPIARRHPWALELASVPDGLEERQMDYVYSHVAPREAVSLRSRAIGRYLGPVDGRLSIVDREMGVREPDATGFVRKEVG